MNITCGPQHATGFPAMWAEWDWSGWIKPQIDNAAALGANCVRLIGVIPSVANGTIPLATYLGRWEQFLDYVTALGLYAYPCGGTLAYWAGVTLAQAEDLFAAWGARMDAYANVIGIDVTNEAFAAGAVAGMTTDQILAAVTALTLTLRAVTSKAITNDRTAHSVARWDHAEGAYLDALNDFHDVHSYYTQAITDPQPWLSKWWGQKPVLIGEFGAGLDLTTSARQERYASAKALVENNPQFVGAIAWATTDTNPSAQYGLFDAAGLARTDICSVFQTFSKARSYYADTYGDVYS